MSVKYSLNEHPKVMILLCCFYSWEIHNTFGYSTCHHMNQAVNACAFRSRDVFPIECAIKKKKKKS